MDSGIYRKWIEDIDALSEAQRKEVQAVLAAPPRPVTPRVPERRHRKGLRREMHSL